MRRRLTTTLAALALLPGLVRAEDESAWTLLEKGLGAWRAKQVDKAERFFEAAARKNAKCEDAYYYLGLIAEKRGDVAKAVALFRQVSAKAPVHVLATERLARIALAQGKREEALKHFAVVAEARPDADVYMQIASIRMDLGQHQAAEKSLDEAGKYTKRNLALHDLRGRLFLETGRHAEALDEYGAILEVVPIDTNARYLRGLCLLELDRTDEAVAEFEDVLKRDPFHGLCLKTMVRQLAGDPAREAQVAEYRKRLAMLAKSKPRVRRVKGD